MGARCEAWRPTQISQPTIPIRKNSLRLGLYRVQFRSQPREVCRVPCTVVPNFSTEMVQPLWYVIPAIPACPVRPKISRLRPWPVEEADQKCQFAVDKFF